MKKYITGAGLADCKIGQSVGNILTQVFKKALALSGKNFQANEAILKNSSANLKDTLKTNSSNIPPETLKLLKELSTFAESADLSSEESVI